MLAAAAATATRLRERADPGDIFACYECIALDSSYLGQRMILAFGADQDEQLKIGSRAPDTNSFGPGWKFRLIEKHRDATVAANWLHRVAEVLKK